MNVCVLVAQSCPTPCDPMDCSPLGSSVHGILQARIVKWVAISFSSGSSWPRNQTWVCCIAGRFFTNSLPYKLTVWHCKMTSLCLQGPKWLALGTFTTSFAPDTGLFLVCQIHKSSFYLRTFACDALPGSFLSFRSQLRYHHPIETPGPRASLVVQWLGICLAMQGTRVRSLV